MPRMARIVVPGVPHHVTQRGNNRQDVFFVDDDRRVYLGLLAEQSRRFGLSVVCHCLMTNHVHLVVIPKHVDSLAKGIGRTNLLYSQYIGRLHRRTGHLWQNRFFSCSLDDEHLVHACGYVERNPLRARMVRLPWRYPWSSAAAHVTVVRGRGRGAIQAHDGELLDLTWWRQRFRPAQWKRMLQRPEDAQIVGTLRSRTHTGRPLGSDSFVSKLERALGRRLRALPVGRPKKETTKKKMRKKRTTKGPSNRLRGTRSG